MCSNDESGVGHGGAGEREAVTGANASTATADIFLLQGGLATARAPSLCGSASPQILGQVPEVPCHPQEAKLLRSLIPVLRVRQRSKECDDCLSFFGRQAYRTASAKGAIVDFPINRLVEGRNAAIVHIRRGHGDIAQ